MDNDKKKLVKNGIYLVTNFMCFKKKKILPAAKKIKKTNSVFIDELKTHLKTHILYTKNLSLVYQTTSNTKKNKSHKFYADFYHTERMYES